MNEPRRLNRSGGASQRLLDSASLDKPSPSSRRHAVNLAATASAFTRTNSSAQQPAAKSPIKTLVTWITVGAAASVVLGIASSSFLDTNRAPHAAAPLLAPSSGAASSPDISAEPASTAARRVPQPSGAAKPIEPWVPSPAASASSTASSAEEVREIEAARSAITEGDNAGAIAQLNLYDSVHPTGHLKPEAMALRIQALLNSGRMKEASTLAAEFQTRYPLHAAAERVKRGIGR